MPAYNFHKQFAAAVESGLKRNTIRRVRKRPTRVGDDLFLYTGMRTTQCRKLGEAECVDVIPLQRNGRLIWYWRHEQFSEQVPVSALKWLAWLDGFESAVEFDDWFTRYEVPTELVLVRW